MNKLLYLILLVPFIVLLPIAHANAMSNSTNGTTIINTTHPCFSCALGVQQALDKLQMQQESNAQYAAWQAAIKNATITAQIANCEERRVGCVSGQTNHTNATQ
jgi:deoxycytidylate deaminase